MPCKLCIIEHSNKRASAYQHLKSVCPKNILSAFTLIFSIISMSLFNAVIGRSVFSIFLENLNVHNPLDYSFAQSTTKSLNNDKILLHRAMAKGQFMSIHLKEHNCLNIIYNVWSTWLRCSSNCLLYLHVSFSIFLYHPVSSLIFWHLTSLSSVFFFT